MKKIIDSIISFLIAVAGFIGGGIWAYQTNWQIEPLILLISSFLEIVGFLFFKLSSKDDLQQKKTSIKNVKNNQSIINRRTVDKQINIQNNKGKIEM